LWGDLVDLQHQNLRIHVASGPKVDITAVPDSLSFHSTSLHDGEGQQQAIIDHVGSVVHSDPMTWKGDGEQSTRNLSPKCSYSALEMWTHEMNVADACMQVLLGILSVRLPPPLHPRIYSQRLTRTTCHPPPVSMHLKLHPANFVSRSSRSFWCSIHFQSENT